MQAGDTLPRIAQAMWGDAGLWTYIAEANGISDPTSIGAGQLLSLPAPDAVGAGSRFGSAILRPYDPSQAIGDTSPQTSDIGVRSR
ncbi:MAG: LysM peptidoglycan-binding domain-containing protein [Sulfuricellaceae bacterium]|nr:LysM peptidoglycan-binding domain-containing protein [Sulfuricellaceae bacterium]